MDMHKTALVKLTAKDARAVLILNIILPGVGTMVAGFKTGGEVAINNIIVGLL